MLARFVYTDCLIFSIGVKRGNIVFLNVDEKKRKKEAQSNATLTRDYFARLK